jgi:outer membrane protein OmpA-like peptidoglycan-associated protein
VGWGECLLIGVGRRNNLVFVSVVALLFAPVSSDAQKGDVNAAPNLLKRHQSIRDELFKTLGASATNYTFKYVVINLPAGVVPGKNFSIPVSHIRYDSTVFFGFDQFALRPNAEIIVRDLAQVIQQDVALRSLLIVGHTDAVGPDDYNVLLSKKRAFTVGTALQGDGVNGAYIRIVPMGKEQPFATNSTAEGRALNRRVEFFISDVPEATQKAVQLIPFNPCFRNDQSVQTGSVHCDDTLKRIPVFSPNSDTKPTGQIELVAKRLERAKLPDLIPNRPSLRELLTPQ